jgi:hypothetical protein
MANIAVNPGMQKQTCPKSMGLHVASLWHGSEKQSFTSRIVDSSVAGMLY